MNVRVWLGNDTPAPASRWGLTPSIWWAYAVVVATCGVGDVLTTAIFLAVHSSGGEGNPVVAYLFQGGLLSWVLLKIAYLLVVYAVSRLVVVAANARWLSVYQIGLYVFAASWGLISISNLMAAFLGNDLLDFLANLLPA
jgi:hypothetical protein